MAACLLACLLAFACSVLLADVMMNDGQQRSSRGRDQRLECIRKTPLTVFFSDFTVFIITKKEKKEEKKERQTPLTVFKTPLTVKRPSTAFSFTVFLNGGRSLVFC
jgi:hypothetical protein